MDKNILMELLAKREFKAVRSVLNVMNAVDIASLLSELEDKELAQAFRLISKEKAADVFANMSNSMQSYLITVFTEKELKEILEDMFMDDTVDLLEDLPANVVTRILENIDSEKRKEINVLLNYPEDSAGTIMTTEYVSLRPDMSVGESILRIRRQGVDKETIYTCYVTQGRTLLGIVTVKDLLLAEDDDQLIQDIMITNIISVSTMADQEEVAQMLSKYNFLALPVVDGENRMVGIVTFDDAMDVMEDEFTEDIEIMGGMTPSEKTYLKSSVFDLFKHRIPWLLLLMVSATFTGMIITSFEDALAAQVALTAFIPMLMDTGGNSGSQSSVTIIRALSLGEVHFSDIGRVIWRELRTAVLCGAVLAAVCFGKIMLIDGLLMHNPNITVTVDAVVCFTLFVTVVLAKFVGCTLPLFAKKFGFDPAVMASPFITTIVDALSLLVYFMFAKALLGV